MNSKSHPGPQESVLATIEGRSETERLVLVWSHSPSQGTRLELRQQSWGEGVGWFTQQSIPLEPEQAAELRWALHGSASPSESRPRHNASVGRAPGPTARPLRIVRAEPA